MFKGHYTLTTSPVARKGDRHAVMRGSTPPRRRLRERVVDQIRGEQMLPPSHVWESCCTAMTRLFVAVLSTILVAGAAYASPPGAVIANQATLGYTDLSGQPSTVVSNEVSVVTAVVRSPANVEMTRAAIVGAGTYQETVGPSACFQGGAFVTQGNPTVLGGIAIDPTQALQVSPTSSYNSGEFAFIRLTDSDQNVDYLVADTTTVVVSNTDNGDSETIQLYETGPDTGVFAGYIQLGSGVAVAGDCILQSAPKSTISVDYADPADSADTAAATAQLDPAQRVFESRTGTVVSGTTIEIVDAISGLPATVYGNDGVSQFPSSIVSGGTATDSSGTLYVFAAGEYRFPVVPDGDYRLVVTPPSAYAAPSSASIAALQALPGAPWQLSPASFGAAFTKSGDVSIALDIPIDPRASALFLQKRTLTTVAAPGDFVRYELVLENSSAAGVATDIVVRDTLPAGVRFVPGSVTVNGTAAADPAIGTDMRTLDFDVTDLSVGGRAQVFYVVEIVSGARNDELVNTATAFAAGGLLSNESTAVIRLTEDLFRTTGTIIGRILEADCGQDTFSEEQGVADVRVYLEDGRYAVSDAGGRFHFEGVDAGTHVAQLDTFSVPAYFDVVGCAQTPGYSGSAEAQFVKLSRGSMKRADFFLRRKEPPHGRIDIEMRNAATESTQNVAYNIDLEGVGNVALENIGVMVVLPTGVSYTPNTLKIDGQPVSEPHLMGPSVSIPLPDRKGNWNSRLSFVATIEDQVDGELVTKAIGKFSTPMQAKQSTPVAETRMMREPAVLENEGYVLDLKFDTLSDTLSAQDKLQLEALIEDWRGVSNVKISATGHSDSQLISPRNQHLFANNFVLSHARAMSAAFYIADALGLSADKIQVEGRGPDDPVADNATAAGRQKNRRVEMILTGIRPTQPSFLEVTQESSGTKETATVGAIPGMEKKVKVDRFANDLAGMPASQVEPALESLQPGYAMLLPAADYAPAIASSKISIQHKPGQTVELTINGDSVSKLNQDSTATNAARTVSISRWVGVDLVDGANEIRAVIRNADGSKAKGIRRTIHYTGVPIRAEFVAELSTLVADGKNTPTIAVRLFDRSGKPSRAGMVGQFRVNAPYRSAWDEERDRKNALVEIGDRGSMYRVDADGIAYIDLAPTTQTGEVTVVLPFENYREQEIRAWLSPAQRDWILVGFAEGSAGYNTLSDNVAAAEDAGLEDEYYDDGRVAFFAKGSIRGDYLLTVAFDSTRDRDDSRDRFDTVVDPNAYYSLYADTAEQRFEAASQRKLYVKLERNQFYALFGDYETGMSITDLARYQRRFNGLKSEYRGDTLGYTVFAAETDQSFNRDEIRGDGTSGLYQLSAAPIIANSDSVRIETRDRFDSGVVLSTQNLARFLDYNLDTLSGTLYFKKPVPSRDIDFNPVYIVVEYESIAAGSDDIVAGGRGSVSFADDRLEFGVSHINDASGGAEADLSGVDMRWQINEQTLLKAEIADSEAIIGGVQQDGSAHSISVEHNGEKVDVRAFMREVDDGFGLGYQSEADKGIRRVGVDARAKVSDRFSVEGEAGWQQNLQTDAIRNLARGQVRYEKDAFTARLGVAHAEDKFDDGEKWTSQLAEVGLTQKVLDGKMRLRLGGSVALNEDAENIDYPTSVVVGADYKILDGVELVAEYEDAEGRDVDAKMTRVGVKASPWSRAQINSFVTNEVTEFGPRLFANVGIIQGFQLNDNWIVDFGVDHSKSLVDANARQFDSDRELSSGSFNEDFFAAYTGAMYTSNLWSANARVEVRDSDREDRLTMLAGWYRQPTEGHGLSAGLTAFTTDSATGGDLSQVNLKFGWAYRLADRKWAFLNRVDLIADEMNTLTSDEKSWRLINNFNANRRIGAATELSLQYAFKYVRSNFDGTAYTGYTDLIGVDLRHGFRDRWDVGVNTSIYHSYQSKVLDYGIGADVGYNVGKNMWLTLGYNFAGFDDKDFEQARYTASGPYLRFTIKADQSLLKRIAGQR
ncbi:MAG: OmpA family protein [Gammaproteobacteria bacterium]|nr:OmpA family protein [Gammaproteobacteria bacterium]